MKQMDLPLRSVMIDKRAVLDAVTERFEQSHTIDDRTDLLDTLVLASEDHEPAMVRLVQSGLDPMWFSPAKKAALFVTAGDAHGIDTRSILQWMKDSGYSVDLVGDVSIRTDELLSQITSQRQSFHRRANEVEQALDPLLPDGLSLDEHQLQVVAFAEQADFKLLVGDDMGLGKTISALGTLLYRSRETSIFPLLVAAPASAVGMWCVEIRKWLSALSPEVVRMSRDLPDDLQERCEDGDPVCLVGSYYWIVEHQRLIQDYEPASIVADESHMLASANSQRTRALLRCRRSTHTRMGLSGTLLPNGRPRELFPQLLIVGLDGLPRWKSFARRFCGPSSRWVKGRKGARRITVYDGLSDAPGLAALTRSAIIERKKHEVDIDLPDKTRYVLDVELSDAAWVRFGLVKDEVRARLTRRADQIAEQLASCPTSEEIEQQLEQMKQAGVSAKERRAAHERLKKRVSAEEIDYRTEVIIAATAVASTTALRIAVGLEKAPTIAQLAIDLLSDGHAPIIAYRHRAVGTAIKNELSKLSDCDVRSGDSSMAGEQRDELVASWQEGHGDILIISTAFSTAVTLHRSDRMIMAERMFVPVDEAQMEDRIHRRGQDQRCAIYYPMVKGTTDDLCAKIVTWKEEANATRRGVTNDRVLQWLDWSYR